MRLLWTHAYTELSPWPVSPPCAWTLPKKALAAWHVYTHWMPLIPRLGAFIGNETRIPYDYHEVLALIAPRPALIVNPTVDSQHTIQDVVQCVNESRKVYDLHQAGGSLAYLELLEYNRFSPEIQRQLIDQLRRML